MRSRGTRVKASALQKPLFEEPFETIGGGKHASKIFVRERLVFLLEGHRCRLATRPNRSAWRDDYFGDFRAHFFATTARNYISALPSARGSDRYKSNAISNRAISPLRVRANFKTRCRVPSVNHLACSIINCVKSVAYFKIKLFITCWIATSEWATFFCVCTLYCLFVAYLPSARSPRANRFESHNHTDINRFVIYYKHYNINFILSIKSVTQRNVRACTNTKNKSEG